MMNDREDPNQKNERQIEGKKQAVIVIHGMGEQIPMETLRGFVETVWITDDSLISRDEPDGNTGAKPRKRNPVWSKPDRRNRSYELHRITTEHSVSKKRTDFFEFYWAHLMHGTTWEHLKAWAVDLLWRPPHKVPKDVFGAWIWLWIITLALGIAALSVPLMDWSWWSTAGPILIVILGGLVNVFLLKYFGDVARYVKASPVNVARRQEIREKGVALLETLMGIDKNDGNQRASREWKSDYDRIIVVGHSLGSIVAYDILKHAFARVNRRRSETANPQEPAREAMEAYLRNAMGNTQAFDTDEFREMQARCREELNEQGNPWVVSDFITLGSPLTHAEFLLAKDEDDLDDLKQERVLPTCPPILEWDKETNIEHFTYRRDETSQLRLPHHAAHFAYTRWTNIYSTSKNILWGDIISGPVAKHFGIGVGSRYLRGIRDIAVLPERNEQGRSKGGETPFFTHTKYWDETLRTGSDESGGMPFHIGKLREAIDLLDHQTARAKG